jgi:hypothetical protein
LQALTVRLQVLSGEGGVLGSRAGQMAGGLEEL